MPKEAALNAVLGTEQTMITSSLSGRKPHLELSETTATLPQITELKGCASVACGNDKLDW